jgi:hypothetical protein
MITRLACRWLGTARSDITSEVLQDSHGEVGNLTIGGDWHAEAVLLS